VGALTRARHALAPLQYRPLAVVLGLGLAVRLFTMVAYDTAVYSSYGGDSARYLRLFNSGGIFSDASMPAGYAAFLRGLRALWPNLPLTPCSRRWLSSCTRLRGDDQLRRALRRDPGTAGGRRGRARLGRPAGAPAVPWRAVSDAETKGATDLTPERAAELAGGGAQVVDVRGDYEHDAGHIAGDEHVPLATLDAEADHFDRDRPVIFYCRSGERSGMAAAAFRASGWDAYHVEGGLLAWAEHGLPLEPESGEVAARPNLPGA
jgi:rhodanese-related sulfurtransferase